MTGSRGGVGEKSSHLWMRIIRGWWQVQARLGAPRSTWRRSESALLTARPQVTVPIGSCALQVSRDGYSAGALLIGLSELLDSALYTLGSCG